MTNKDSDLIFEAYRDMLYEETPDSGFEPLEVDSDDTAEEPFGELPDEEGSDPTAAAGTPTAPSTPEVWQAGDQFTDEDGIVMVVVSPMNTSNNGTNAHYAIKLPDNTDPLLPGQHPDLLAAETEAANIVDADGNPDEVNKAKHMDTARSELSKTLVVVEPEDDASNVPPFARTVEDLKAKVDQSTHVTKRAMAKAGKAGKPGMLGRFTSGALGTLTPQSKTLGALKSFGQKTATQGWRSGLGIKPEDPYQKALAAKAKQ